MNNAINNLIWESYVNSLNKIPFKYKDESLPISENNAIVEIFELADNYNNLDYMNVINFLFSPKEYTDDFLSGISKKYFEEFVEEHEDDEEYEEFETYKTILEWVNQRYPITTNPTISGYLLQNGKYFAMTYHGDARDIDHREVYWPNAPEDNLERMNEFMNKTGCIRINGDKGTFDIKTQPTNAQYKQIYDILKNSIEGGFIDVSLGDKKESISDIISPNQGISFIRNFYSN